MSGNINWGLAGNGNSALSAFAGGMQLGGAVRARREQAEERKQAEEKRSALSAYAIDPSEGNLNALAPYAPEVVMQERGRMASAESAQADKRRADLPMLANLLDQASQGPEQWQRAMNIAQRYGIDVSGVPQEFDPEWAKSQAQTMKLLQAPEGKEILSTAGKVAYDEGLRPGDGKFEPRVTEIWQQSGAIPYTGAGGETRLYVPGRGQQSSQTITEGTIIENENKPGERMIMRNGKWEPLEAGGTASNGGGNFQR